MAPRAELKLELPYHTPLPNSPSSPTSSRASSPDSEQGHSYPPPAQDTEWGDHPSLNEQRRKSMTHRGLVSLGLFLLLVVAVAALGGTSDVVDKLSEQKDAAINKGAETFAEWREWLFSQAELEDEQAMDDELYLAESSPSESGNQATASAIGYTYESVATTDVSEDDAESGWEEEQETNTAEESEAIMVEDEAAAESSESETSVPATGPIAVSALPRPRLAQKGDNETKYLGFFPHSGFHNQRIEFENALLLGYLLNRTVLVPPVWLGWPVSTKPYDVLETSWTEAVSDSAASFNLTQHTSLHSELSQPVNFRSADNSSSSIFKKRAPPTTDCTSARVKECMHVYKDTFLSWDFISNLDSLAAIVPIVDRWDMRPRALLRTLSLSQEDVLVFRDRTRYDFQFSDAGPLGNPSSALLSDAGHSDGPHKFTRAVSLGALRERPERLVLLGTLFGQGRVESESEGIDALKERISQSLAFRNEYLTRPAGDVAQRLGESYLAIHARLADGGFLDRAQENMELTWREMMRQLKVDNVLIEQLWDTVRPAEQPRGTFVKRNAKQLSLPVIDYSFLDEEEGAAEGLENSQLPPVSLRKRAPIGVTPVGWTLNNLSCRSPLYTQPEMLQFNKPLYLATDSRDPTNDPHLAIFFKTFPCTFVLSDFSKPGEVNGGVIVDTVEQMSRLVNEADGIALGIPFLPFLEALVAAKADVVVGTRGSTFSKFAEGALHHYEQHAHDV